MKVGYSLICEEHPPQRLLENGRLAEETGFDFLSVSDHFHPWLSAQGQSPFVWSVLGGLSQTTQDIEIGTAVTCPIMRYHPAIVAQAAATSACLLEGRFHLGVGSGEALNESIVGVHWPETNIRHQMLAEAVEVIRKLWSGQSTSHHGKYYTLENATIFTLPEKLPPIYVAAAGPQAAELAAEIGDGFWGLEPSSSLIDTFLAKGGKDKPRYGQFHVCVAGSVKQARKTVHKQWANGGLSGELNWILPTPRHFEQAVEMVNEEMACKNIVCGDDPEEHLEMIRKFAQAGYTAVSIHNIGSDQSAFFELYREQILPELSRHEKLAGVS